MAEARFDQYLLAFSTIYVDLQPHLREYMPNVTYPVARNSIEVSFFDALSALLPFNEQFAFELQNRVNALLVKYIESDKLNTFLPLYLCLLSCEKAAIEPSDLVESLRSVAVTAKKFWFLPLLGLFHYVAIVDDRLLPKSPITALNLRSVLIAFASFYSKYRLPKATIDEVINHPTFNKLRRIVINREPAESYMSSLFNPASQIQLLPDHFKRVRQPIIQNNLEMRAPQRNPNAIQEEVMDDGEDLRAQQDVARDRAAQQLARERQQQARLEELVDRLTVGGGQSVDARRAQIRKFIATADLTPYNLPALNGGIAKNVQEVAWGSLNQEDAENIALMYKDATDGLVFGIQGRQNAEKLLLARAVTNIQENDMRKMIQYGTRFGFRKLLAVFEQIFGDYSRYMGPVATYSDFLSALLEIPNIDPMSLANKFSEFTAEFAASDQEISGLKAPYGNFSLPIRKFDVSLGQKYPGYYDMNTPLGPAPTDNRITAEVARNNIIDQNAGVAVKVPAFKRTTQFSNLVNQITDTFDSSIYKDKETLLNLKTDFVQNAFKLAKAQLGRQLRKGTINVTLPTRIAAGIVDAPGGQGNPPTDYVLISLASLLGAESPFPTLLNIRFGKGFKTGGKSFGVVGRNPMGQALGGDTPKLIDLVKFGKASRSNVSVQLAPYYGYVDSMFAPVRQVLRTALPDLNCRVQNNANGAVDFVTMPFAQARMGAPYADINKASFSLQSRADFIEHSALMAGKSNFIRFIDATSRIIEGALNHQIVWSNGNLAAAQQGSPQEFLAAFDLDETEFVLMPGANGGFLGLGAAATKRVLVLKDGSFIYEYVSRADALRRFDISNETWDSGLVPLDEAHYVGQYRKVLFSLSAALKKLLASHQATHLAYTGINQGQVYQQILTDIQQLDAQVSLLANSNGSLFIRNCLEAMLAMVGDRNVFTRISNLVPPALPDRVNSLTTERGVYCTPSAGVRTLYTTPDALAIEICNICAVGNRTQLQSYLFLPQEAFTNQPQEIKIYAQYFATEAEAAPYLRLMDMMRSFNYGNKNERTKISTKRVRSYINQDSKSLRKLVYAFGGEPSRLIDK